jgi:hypothetical protein
VVKIYEQENIEILNSQLEYIMDELDSIIEYKKSDALNYLYAYLYRVRMIAVKLINNNTTYVNFMYTYKTKKKMNRTHTKYSNILKKLNVNYSEDFSKPVYDEFISYINELYGTSLN